MKPELLFHQRLRREKGPEPSFQGRVSRRCHCGPAQTDTIVPTLGVARLHWVAGGSQGHQLLGSSQQPGGGWVSSFNGEEGGLGWLTFA